MSKVYIFRGKAATGKTTITNQLSTKMNIAVLRKDDIFDKLSQHIMDQSQNNKVSYDILAELIQTSVNNKNDIIVDAGLSNTEGLKMFLSKINFKDSQVFYFLCDCSDNEMWIKRFDERFKNPKPNQYFKSADEIVIYYNNLQITLLNNEVVLDSSHNLDMIIDKIYEVI